MHDAGAAHISRHQFATTPRLVLRSTDCDQAEISKSIRGRRRSAARYISLAVGIEYWTRVVAGAERRHHITFLTQHPRLRAIAGRAPHRRMRLLIRPRPDVHLTIMKVLPFPIEWRVMARHGFEDEVVRLPKTLHEKHRILIRRRGFVGHPLHKAHVEAAAGNHIDGRELFGAA